MQFLITAYDSTDPDVLSRRMASRPEHVRVVDALRDQRKVRFGAALLDENHKMIGSIMIFDVASREELDSLLAKEPYVTNRVWGEVEIRPCQVGPSFENK